MLDTVINFIAKWSGAAAVWDAIDGYKAYGTCALGILGGLSGLGAELAPILASHNTAGLVSFLTHVATDPSYLLLLGSCAAIAKLHRVDKAAAGVVPGGAPVPTV